jgi:hypothetical protein
MTERQQPVSCERPFTAAFVTAFERFVIIDMVV